MGEATSDQRQLRMSVPEPRASSSMREFACDGATVWLTGLPGAGKSSLARAVARLLDEDGVTAYHLDGDKLREGLCRDLGFDRDSRAENVRRTAEVAKLLAGAKAVAVVSLVSPFRSDRNDARRAHQEVRLPFVEVWLDTPLAECERRDHAGLYARARRGEVHQVTGLDDPYEPPINPELIVRPADGDPAEAAKLVLGALRAHCGGARRSEARETIIT